MVNKITQKSIVYIDRNHNFKTFNYLNEILFSPNLLYYITMRDAMINRFKLMKVLFYNSSSWDQIILDFSVSCEVMAL